MGSLLEILSVMSGRVEGSADVLRFCAPLWHTATIGHAEIQKDLVEGKAICNDILSSLLKLRGALAIK